MRVLHIFPSPHLGGSELCALESIKSLTKLGVENYAILPISGDVENRLRQLKVEYQVVPNNWWMSAQSWKVSLKLIMLKGFYSASKKICTYINEQGIDVVITHTIVIPSGAIAAKRASKPHIWYLHEYGDLDHQLQFEYGKTISLTIINALSKKIIVNSSALKKHFSKYIPSEKINKVNYAVCYPEFGTVNANNSEQLTICMVGRIAKGKNQLVALKALAQLKTQHIFPLLYFVGGADNKYLAELNTYIEQHKLEDQVVFAGQTDQPWEFVLRSEIVLVCSLMEAFGRVSVEGMKAGRILVVSNTGAGAELIQDKESGYLFEPENEQQLASILKDIWIQKDYSVMTTKAKQFAIDHFNLASHGQDLLNRIKEIL